MYEMFLFVLMYEVFLFVLMYEVFLFVFMYTVFLFVCYVWGVFVSFTIGTECWQVWCQECCGSALVVLCSLEHMKRPRSIYRHGRVYPVTVITDSSFAVHACVCVCVCVVVFYFVTAWHCVVRNCIAWIAVIYTTTVHNVCMYCRATWLIIIL